MDDRTEIGNVVHLFCAGRFGEAVQQHLLRYRDDLLLTTTVDGALSPSLEGLPPAKMLALATWRPDSKTCAALDRISHQTGVPFLPLTIEMSNAIVGPLVIPGRSCCWRCWERRTQQNFPWQSARHALQEFYEKHPECGPEGYLETVAAMAAAKMAQVINEVERGCAAPGVVWRLDLITRSVETYTAVGVHDCPRCGLRRPPETRTIDLISQELKWLWKQQDNLNA